MHTSASINRCGRLSVLVSDAIYRVCFDMSEFGNGKAEEEPDQSVRRTASKGTECIWEDPVCIKLHQILLWAISGPLSDTSQMFGTNICTRWIILRR